MQIIFKIIEKNWNIYFQNILVLFELFTYYRYFNNNFFFSFLTIFFVLGA